MATDLKTKITLKVEAIERETGVGVASAASRLRHYLELVKTFENGTSANESDTVVSVAGTVTSAAPDDYDLQGGITSFLTGDANSMAEVNWIILKNTSTTATENIQLGGGSNPITTMWGASGDVAVIGPGGLLILGSPIDGYGVTATTADILRVSTGTATPVGYELIVIGRTA